MKRKRKSYLITVTVTVDAPAYGAGAIAELPVSLRRPYPLTAKGAERILRKTRTFHSVVRVKNALYV